ncbi:MAG: sensor histidine kinase [Hamadaea sp.]|uniref:sensor histidine kinase n=1 Tax=Hamadaea sp. TaxID=2024425 RepID=UPI0017AE84BD|nr:histidine kinase [Hamadaea sp.]NUR71012.1 sensor histidine kinase [Hamadaea sp.]NUT23693.1 sensor histidine kinase [Hamadaea sp.]
MPTWEQFERRVVSTANVLLAGALAATAALVALAVTVSWGGRAALFGLVTGLVTGMFALLRDRLPGAYAAVAGLAVAAVATPIASAFELPREPGPASILALSVLVGAAIRRQPVVWGGLVTAAYAVIVVGSHLLAPATSSGTVTGFAVLGWLGAVTTGLSLRLVDLRRRYSADQVRRDERLALARELHDVAAHHLTGIVVQTQAARIVARTRPAEVADALAEIETAAAEALTATRRVVGVLRDSGDAPPTTPQPEGLADLVRRFPGPPVDLRTPPEYASGAAWPPELATTVYRIVQESLTNVARHAPGARQVSVTVESPVDGVLTVRVADDGPATSSGLSSGVLSSGVMSSGVMSSGVMSSGSSHGLLGMRERVSALGGTLTAGPAPGGGWVVSASLPAPGARGSSAPAGTSDEAGTVR